MLHSCPSILRTASQTECMQSYVAGNDSSIWGFELRPCLLHYLDFEGLQMFQTSQPSTKYFLTLEPPQTQ